MLTEPAENADLLKFKKFRIECESKHCQIRT